MSSEESSHTVEVLREHQEEEDLQEYLTIRLRQEQDALKTLVDRHGTHGWSPDVRAEIKRVLGNIQHTIRELNRLRNARLPKEPTVQRARFRQELRALDRLSSEKL